MDACQKRAKNRIVAYRRCTSAFEMYNDELILFSDNEKYTAMTRKKIYVWLKIMYFVRAYYATNGTILINNNFIFNEKM